MSIVIDYINRVWREDGQVDGVTMTMDEISSSSNIFAKNPLARAINNQVNNRRDGITVGFHVKVDRVKDFSAITCMRASTVLLKFELQEFWIK